MQDYQEDIWKCCILLGVPIVDTYAKILQFLKDILPASSFNKGTLETINQYSKYHNYTMGSNWK